MCVCVCVCVYAAPVPPPRACLIGVVWTGWSNRSAAGRPSSLPATGATQRLQSCCCPTEPTQSPKANGSVKHPSLSHCPPSPPSLLPFPPLSPHLAFPPFTHRCTRFLCVSMPFPLLPSSFLASSPVFSSFLPSNPPPLSLPTCVCLYLYLYLH